jgi:hypothetical protein
MDAMDMQPLTFRLFCLELGALILGALPAHAQVLCQLTDTENTCRDRVKEAYNTDPRVVSEETAADALASKNTGDSPAASPLSASSFNDFFSTLKAGLDSGSSDSDQDDGAVGFELSRCARDEQPVAGVQCQVRLRAGGAQLYEPIKNALPDATRDTRAKELEDGLDFGDRIAVGGFVNLVSNRWGRVPRFGDDPIYEEFWTAINEEVAISKANSATIEYAAIRKKVQAKLCPDPGTCATFDANTPFAKVFEIDAELAKAALAGREAEVRAEFDNLVQTQKLLEGYGYYDFVDLVNNQPQLNFGVEYVQNGDFAGPDEWRAKISYEYGFVNINSTHEYIDKHCRQAADAQHRTLACLQDYLGDEKTRKRLKGGDRLAASIEYISRRKYSLALPDDAVSLDEKSTRSLIGALVYGFYTSFDQKGNARSRLDIEANYEDVSNDPARQDRGKAVATFSQTLFDKTTLSISLIYATKPEFRGDVDEELTGRLGFNYKWGKLTEF